MPHSRPWYAPFGPWQRRPAVPAMRVLSQLISSKWRSYDAARGIAAALVSMQAARLLPGSTRSAAEPTTGATAAAASADTDENGRVCVGVGGLGPCPLLATGCCSRRHRSTSGLLVRTNCVHRAHHVQRGARDGHGLLIAALTALVRAPFGRGSEGLRYLPCGAVAADLEQTAQPEASQRLWF